jgi:ribosomal protein S18 acetylase RimI-like enzyme
MTLDLVVEEPLISQVRSLFTEYQAGLGIDLCFQGFAAELEGLPGEYQPPQGRLYLASDGDTPMGCVALHAFDEDHCEMKRLYVRPEFQGQGLGKKLAELIISDASAIGYSKIWLDTLPAMTVAQALYRSLGFVETEAYRYNPVPGTVYMYLDLKPVGHRRATR